MVVKECVIILYLLFKIQLVMIISNVWKNVKELENVDIFVNMIVMNVKINIKIVMKKYNYKGYVNILMNFIVISTINIKKDFSN